jgi:hypothetical protein
MKKIPLSQGQFALIDDIDFERVNQHKWHAFYHKDTKSYYACHTPNYASPIYMHRFILKAKKGKTLDHINHNTLDNRRKNLRPVTRTQNNLNCRKLRNASSTYKGVCWNKYHGKWVAVFTAKGKTNFLGYHSIPEEAAKAYDKAAYAFDPVHALLNFPHVKST